MAAVFVIQHAQTYDSIPSSLSMLPDPGNMVVPIRISLLLCIRAEIHIIFYLHPVNGRHLRFPKAQANDSIPSSLSVLPDLENMGVTVGILLL